MATNAGLRLVVLASIVLSTKVISTELPMAVKLDVISNVRTALHCECVMLIDDSTDSYLAPKEMFEIQKLLMNINIPSAMWNLRTLNESFPNFYCRIHRILNVLIVNGERTIHHIHKNVMKFRRLSPRWLMFLEDAKQIKQYFKDVDIPFDAEFLVAQRSLGDAVVLTEVYRVSRALPLQTYPWGQWYRGDGLQGDSTFLYTRRNNLAGLVFKAAAVHNPPFESVDVTNDVHPKFDGFFPQIWKDIADVLNISTIYYREHTWGAMQDNNSWSGVLGQLITGKMDVGVNGFYMTSSRQVAVDYTRPLLISRACVIIRTPDGTSAKWTVFLSPFSVGIWLSTAGCLIIIACVQAGVHRPRYRYGDRNIYNCHIYSLQNCIFRGFGSLCSQSEYQLSNRWRRRKLSSE